ncbi:DUF1236 domain-containing protein [Neorhizobium sp. T6_25]|jgi:hypothetical protein|uniref:DUF1236 domain-containing protein n=1 Tax=Neorhizobium sp. T6_25 TaxID=2093833 RepID=UPI000CF90C4D|nr:DUF1236 domain-containing protein [Neorhizobium sp. T6_25]
MRLFNRKALLVALLAGSTLSLPALAQNSSGGSADPRLLPKEGTSKQGSASGSQGTKATAPEAGASGQSAGSNSPEAKQQPAQNQAQSEQLRKPGEAGSGASKDGQSAATKDSQSKTGTDAAQTDDQKKKMNQDAAAGSGTDQTKQSAQGSGTSTEKKDTNAASSTTQTSPDNNTNTASGTQQRQSNETDAASADRPSNEVTGSINISTEQKTEIRNIIVENKVEPIKPSFSVSVGVAVPKTVELRPLPPRVVEILPAYRSYRYFVLADNRIVIVEPDTYEIVYILVV